MAGIPRDKNPDSTLAFALDGHLFVSKRCERYRSDVFQTRLILQKTICMRGEEVARTFYDENRFERKGTAPKRLQATLFGRGGVQRMDDSPHHHRKQMFLSLMTPAGIQQLADLSAEQ